MCKVLAMAGIPAGKEENVKKFLKTAAKHMSKVDKDGLGYAAINQHGLYSERWVNPRHAFKFRTNWYGPKELEILNKLREVTGTPFGYAKSGKFDAGNFTGTSAVIMHTRYATQGDVDITNTHPFLADKSALIHNGHISNFRSLVNKTSTCDSETILNEYVDKSVSINPKSIQKVSDTLSGSFACAVLSEDVLGKPILDIFRNSGSFLVFGYVEQLGTMVFCTNEEILKNTCKDLKWKLGVVNEFLNSRFLRLDAKTGIPIVIEKFTYATKFEAVVGINTPIAGPRYEYDDDEAYLADTNLNNEDMQPRVWESNQASQLTDDELEQAYAEEMQDFDEDEVNQLFARHMLSRRRRG